MRHNSSDGNRMNRSYQRVNYEVLRVAKCKGIMSIKTPLQNTFTTQYISKVIAHQTSSSTIIVDINNW